MICCKCIWTLILSFTNIKGKAQFVQKVTFEPLMDIKQNHYSMEIENVTKAATFKSFLHPNYKNTQLSFFVTVLFNYFYKTNINR